MAQPSPQMQAILDFVSGALRSEMFAKRLHADPSFASVLNDSKELPSPSYISNAGCANTYEFVLGLDFASVAGALNAQGALAQFLERRGIPYRRTTEYERVHHLLLSAQPSWLDVDMTYLQDAVLANAPPGATTPVLKKWLAARLRELFRFATKPPRWVQSPQWPIRDGAPLVFLGQLPVKGYFHDTAAVYVFHDPGRNECEAVVQVH